MRLFSDFLELVSWLNEFGTFIPSKQIFSAFTGISSTAYTYLMTDGDSEQKEAILAIENFLVDHPEFVREPVDAPWFTPAGEGAFRLWPHKLLGEGHFAAVLRKTEGEEAEVQPASGEKLPKDCF